MTTYLVLTIIGEDRPGIVESLAEIISDHSGNWLESSMSQLAGKFAGILRVSVKEDKCEALINSLENLSKNLKLVIEKVSSENYEEVRQIVEVRLIGNDRPGIIREISKTVTDLAVTSECAPAPMSGDALFKASASLKIPKGVSVDLLKRALENLADDLIVDIK